MDVYKTFFKKVEEKQDICHYRNRLDTYGNGCFYDCKYCYSKQVLNPSGFWYPDDVAVVSLRDIAKYAGKLHEGQLVRLGGMSDCLQPIENIHRNTYKIIRFLNRRRVHQLIVTKSNLIRTQNYIDVLDKELSHIQISISTNDNDVLMSMGNSSTFEEMVDTVETLFEKGFDVSLRLSPFLFETVDFDSINNINVDKCLVEFLCVKPSMKVDLGEYISFDDYSYKYGGYNHLPLVKKLEVLDKLDFNELSVCDGVKEHHNYFQENVNFNPEDCCNIRL